MTDKKGKLFLFPHTLTKKGADKDAFLTPALIEAVGEIDGIIAESMTGGLSFMKMFQTKKAPHNMPICLFNKKTPDEDINFVLEPLLKGETWGFVADAGLPCVADPGAKLVRKASLKKLEVKAFYGPSSIFLSLMLSGFNGQNFAFNGYLASNKENMEKELRVLENRSKNFKSTQIFIEAPYRNTALLESCIKVLDKKTALCMACDLTTPEEVVISKKVCEWEGIDLSEFHKRPAIFLIDYHSFR
ncbi:hypothetical protein AB751O23_BC_00060 [Chlamydiales bacterium SCGC AB-751-O23]|jgi:16S rRNA (cytidine1402-2'-O)-methyltransferase|nr:hypothetical protein AB751O23_BC_00060 [Chlamydiales bacterium SCGC AB-751-O23]